MIKIHHFRKECPVRTGSSFVTLLLPVCFFLTWAESTCPAGYSGSAFRWRPSGPEPSADTQPWKSAPLGFWCCELRPEPLCPRRPGGVEPRKMEESDENEAGQRGHGWRFIPVIINYEHWTMINKPLGWAASHLYRKYVPHHIILLWFVSLLLLDWDFFRDQTVRGHHHIESCKSKEQREQTRF